MHGNVNLTFFMVGEQFELWLHSPMILVHWISDEDVLDSYPQTNWFPVYMNEQIIVQVKLKIAGHPG